MNWFIALKVVCCEPVAVSPEIWISPAGVSPPNASGIPPLELKKLTIGSAMFRWLLLRPVPGGGTKLRTRLRYALLAS